MRPWWRCNATTGAAAPGFVSPTLNPKQSVPLALAASGDTLYVGGNFEAADGSPHRGLVALDPQTGRPLQSFDATVPTSNGETGSVFSLLLVGDQLYLGGDFDAVAGEPRNGFAVLDASNGHLLASDAVPPNDYVLSLALSGQAVMAAGKAGGG